MKLNETQKVWLKLGIPAVVGVIVAGVMISIGVMDSLDARFFYTPEEAQSYFFSLSEQKAAQYMLTEWLDLVFILSYSVFLYFAFSLTYPKKNGAKRFALATGFFDLCETLGIITALQIGPRPEITSWLGIVTMLKWTTATIAIGALLVKFYYFCFSKSKN